MTNDHLKTQLKQLLKQGHSEIELIHLSRSSRMTLDSALEEHRSEQKLTQQTLCTQHNQANFAMQLAY